VQAALTGMRAIVAKESDEHLYKLFSIIERVSHAIVTENLDKDDMTILLMSCVNEWKEENQPTNNSN
jgi:hypothetical protein